MAEVEDSQSQQQQQLAPSQQENVSQKLEKVNLSSSFSIWPPTQRTRDAVINRLIQTLSEPSVLSKRYGSMPQEEASSTARAIEEEAFAAASASVAGSGGGTDATPASIDEGIEILQLYSKEISKRMLDAVKSKAANSTPEVSSALSLDPAAAESETATSEETSSVKNASSD